LMDELSERSLTGARFHRVDLAGASFDHVDLSGANFYEVDLSGVKMRGAYLRDVDIAGDLDSMRVNGVDVADRSGARPAAPGAGKAATERRRRVPRGMGRDRAAVGRDRRPGPTARPRPDARVVADLTDDQLDGSTEPVAGPGWPPPESFPVREILAAIINEEWWHRQFAERDLAALAASGGQP
jgi:uncharacterized protein YjbI with pentapeptide repeats